MVIEIPDDRIREFAERVEKMTDEEVAGAVLAINSFTNRDSSDKQAEEREIARTVREQLIEEGRLDEVLGSMGMKNSGASPSPKRAKRKQIRIDYSMIGGSDEPAEPPTE